MLIRAQIQLTEGQSRHLKQMAREEKRSVSALLAAGRRRLSLVDCVSFFVCRKHKLRQVYTYTFDDNFSEQGFT